MPDRRHTDETLTSGELAPLPTPPPVAPEPVVHLDLGIYRDLGPLGRGGTAEVRRVWDPALSRVLALKVLLPELAARPSARGRFVAEAHMVARLQHPGIVPIHAIGELPDGRPFYTMTEIRGHTLRDTIRATFASRRTSAGVPPPGERGAEQGQGEAPLSGDWTVRRLVEAHHRICEAMAFAHAEGVVHRDIKPANIMLGAFGEAILLDWGLARAIDATEPDEPRDSKIVGTPTYMPPEQARGEAVGPPADVYALGATLYEVLTGRAPYAGHNHWALLVSVLQGPPPDVRIGTDVPDDLAAILERAMARGPADRLPHAGALAAELGAWLDGARRREQALALVAEADALAPRVEALRARAATLRAEAERGLAEVKGYTPVEVKRPAWRHQDEAARVDVEADLHELEFTRLLRAAQTQVPGLEEARARLAGFERAHHAAAEARGDTRAAAAHEARLRLQDRGEHARYLDGAGAVTLHTDPPGARVSLHAYVLEDRRLVPRYVRELGVTPLDAVELPMGSWLLTIEADDHEVVRYPVHLRRNEHWDGVPPEGGPALPIRLPRRGELGPEDCYAPAGWFWAGGDPLGPTSLPRERLWADGFVMRRFPTRLGQYMAFLDAVLAVDEERAIRLAPQERTGTLHGPGMQVLGRADGRFVVVCDEDGDTWQLEWPACMIGQNAMVEWTRWEAGRSGLPWRLPWELEWEKAARGVDGRLFPWGDFLDPTWTCMRDSHSGRAILQPVDSFPVDESPYGVRGMAGNIRNLCGDLWRPEGPPRQGGRFTPEPAPEEGFCPDRGGSWAFDPSRCRSAARGPVTIGWRSNFQGFRIARPFG